MRAKIPATPSMTALADLNDIAVFVRVAQFESFSRAARALGMPVSTVSRKVTALEERLGVTLLQRTTRKLSLTSQGRAYFDQCSEPLVSRVRNSLNYSLPVLRCDGRHVLQRGGDERKTQGGTLVE